MSTCEIINQHLFPMALNMKEEVARFLDAKYIYYILHSKYPYGTACKQTMDKGSNPNNSVSNFNTNIF